MHAYAAELLAPAGNTTCLHAAVRAGANAVYLGAGDFNARRGADNFSLDDLSAACDFAHLRGVRIYLTLNTVVFPSELDAAEQLAADAYAAGVDAFIVQDIGVAARIRRRIPQACLHASTQMNIHSAAGVRAAADLGISRVTFARELGLAELGALCAEAHALGMETEAFAHGALCICYSGQCYASAALGQRSANRGMCAQACRLPYQLIEQRPDGTREDVGAAAGPHLLSPKDLCAVDMLPDLLAAGVDSFKIEGRMKAPEYVYAVVSTYRAVLDRALAAAGEGGRVPAEAGAKAFAQGSAAGTADASDPQAVLDVSRAPEAAHALPDENPVRARPEERQQLSEAFSRGFSQAYLSGQTGNELMSYARPNNRGVQVGRVARVADGLVYVSCEHPLERGDVIEFWTGAGHPTHTVADFQQVGKGQVAFAVSAPVGKGDRVFRVRSAAAAFEDDAWAPLVPVAGSVRLRLGRPVELELYTVDGLGAAAHSDVLPSDAGAQGLPPSDVGTPGASDAPGAHVFVQGPVVEAARTKAVGEDEVREHIGRFGNTPFALRSLDVELDEGVGIGFSQLHKLRAQALEELQDTLLSPWKARTAPSALSHPNDALTGDGGRTRCSVVVLATNPACVQAARDAGADRVYVPALNLPAGQAQIGGVVSADARAFPEPDAVVLPVAHHDALPGTREATFGFDVWDACAPGSTVVAESLGQVREARARGYRVEAGAHANIVNPESAALLASLGVERAWASPELTLEQLRAIRRASALPLGVVLIGQQELMVTEHCLLAAQGPCNRACTTCARRHRPHFLRDRKGFDMPVVTDCVGRSHLYNAVQLDIAHAATELVEAGIDAFMVDTTLMTPEQAAAATVRALHARDGALSATAPHARSPRAHDAAPATPMPRSGARAYTPAPDGAPAAARAAADAATNAAVERAPRTTTGHLFRPVL